MLLSLILLQDFKTKFSLQHYNKQTQFSRYILLKEYKHLERNYVYSMNRLEQLRRIQKQAFDLFARKNADYGDAFANYGAVGVLVRIGDKLNRLASVTNNQIVLVDDETLRDTLIDLHNYSAMAIMCLDEQDIKNNNVIELGPSAIDNMNERTD